MRTITIFVIFLFLSIPSKNYCYADTLSSLDGNCVIGNCKNGKGTLLFPGGFKFVGDFVNGMMNICFP